MTVYDCANELAREMRATREFAVLKEAKAKLAAEPELKILFLQLQIVLCFCPERLNVLGIVHLLILLP